MSDGVSDGVRDHVGQFVSDHVDDPASVLVGTGGNEATAPTPGQRARHLYVHVPFCSRRCTYCDFAITVRRQVPVEEYLAALEGEFVVRRLDAALERLDTVYLGGGTPSRLGALGIARVLEIVRRHARIGADAEVTIEANPEDITPTAVEAWRAAGVNRLSIGVQSFDDAVLAWMHRVHDGDGARRAIRIARDGGIDAMSIDLIFALPDGIVRDWQRDLDAVVALAPQHVSLYGLTVEPGTPLERRRARGEVHDTPDERYEAEFLAAHEVLGQAGYEHYEVSNFARPGHRARHNSSYWRGVPYVGIGPSAHGFDRDVRRWNLRDYRTWSEAVAAGGDPLDGEELLSPENRCAEAVYLGLRTVDGLAVAASEQQRIARWVEAGWIVPVTPGRSGLVDRVRCTPQGWLRLDALAADLTAIRSHS